MEGGTKFFRILPTFACKAWSG